ncbi:hypothetical protein D3C86_1944150 [compost metagenome]
MNDAGFGVADNLRTVRQNNRQTFIVGAMNSQPEYLAMPQCRQESCSTLKNGVFSHLIKALEVLARRRRNPGKSSALKQTYISAKIVELNPNAHALKASRYFP